MNQTKLHQRYSVKKFDPTKKLPDEQIQLLCDGFHLAPSSINIQGWKLVVVADSELKARAATVFMDTNPQRVRDASHLFVLCRKQSIAGSHLTEVMRTTEIFKKFSPKLISLLHIFAFFKGKSWVTNQVYLALGFLLALCAEEGIGCIPMEGFHKGKLDRILGLKGFCSVATIALGVPHEEDATNPSRLRKSRLPYDQVITRL